MPSTQFGKFLQNVGHLIAALTRQRMTGEIVILMHEGRVKAVRIVHSQTFAPDKLPKFDPQAPNRVI